MIDNAIEKFQQVVGEEYTLTSDEQLIPYHQATIPVERRIAAVIQPGSTEEIQKVIRCANEFNIWFTVIAESVQRIEGVLEELRAKLNIGYDDVLDLPVTQLFKLDARFKPTK